MKFAELNLFIPFVLANALFWILDFIGNFERARLYKAQEKDFDSVFGNDVNHEHDLARSAESGESVLLIVCH